MLRWSVPMLACMLPGLAAGQGLSWQPADAAALRSWEALLRTERDLAADARAARFDAKRGLRMIRTDLDGDGRPETLLSPRLDSWCGSAGCVVFVLRGGQVVCQTYAQHGVRGGDIRLLPREAAGWRGFDATRRVRFVVEPDGAVACAEEDRPRPRQ